MLPLLIIRPNSEEILSETLNISFDQSLQVNSKDFHNAILTNKSPSELFMSSILQFAQKHDPENQNILFMKPENKSNNSDLIAKLKQLQLYNEQLATQNNQLEKQIKELSMNTLSSLEKQTQQLKESLKNQDNKNEIPNDNELKLQNEISQKNIKIAQLMDDIQALNGEKSKLGSQITSLKSEIDKSLNENLILKKAAEDQSIALASNGSKIEQLQNQLKEQKEQNDKEKEEFKRKIEVLQNEKAEIIQKYKLYTNNTTDGQLEEEKRVNEDLRMQIQKLMKDIEEERNDIKRREKSLSDKQLRWKEEEQNHARILGITPEELRDTNKRFEQQMMALEKAKAELNQKRDKINSNLFKSQLAEKSVDEKLEKLEKEKQKIDQLLKEYNEKNKKREIQLDYDRLYDKDIYIEPFTEMIPRYHAEDDLDPQTQEFQEFPYDPEEDIERTQVRRPKQTGRLRDILFRITS
ncbi:hypothetical protein TVAG_048180 [Trichomonas vaginalis G3]|uniref:Uncharacterized protein n=1 Tax=Trichomonas vaginalis (strain ATCC PRA-98 / G3) TaxID=412133 RepID=A2FCP2_TRIV3|nr:hypothetical protein TVAGG3_0287390 [Trichomonas vaginalis G3]EAX97317.1 hypothetical protein TVAG_048180 [Trichomonas vaginalis G3]KAI5526998.1 hypothetical protein TVAGG3_0287390 [Trichomonas vaginalis G3]|eukprot:XP_001310247.1 hypothetical protein [Trichomonas vaginalis G3]